MHDVPRGEEEDERVRLKKTPPRVAVSPPKNGIAAEGVMEPSCSTSQSFFIFVQLVSDYFEGNNDI